LEGAKRTPCKIGTPAFSWCEYATDRQERYQGYQLHYRTDGPLNMDAIVAEYADQTSLAAHGREIDECPIVFHEGLEVVNSIRQHPF